MLKQFIIIIVTSIIIVLVGSYLHYILNALLGIYHWVYQVLVQIFSQGLVARIITQTLALLIPPLFLAGIGLCICWLLKRPANTIFIAILWGVWLLLIPLVYLTGQGAL